MLSVTGGEDDSGVPDHNLQANYVLFVVLLRPGYPVLVHVAVNSLISLNFPCHGAFGAQSGSACSNPAGTSPGATITERHVSLNDKLAWWSHIGKRRNSPVVPTSVQAPQLLARCHSHLTMGTCGCWPSKTSGPSFTSLTGDPSSRASESVSGAPA